MLLRAARPGGGRPSARPGRRDAPSVCPPRGSRHCRPSGRSIRVAARRRIRSSGPWAARTSGSPTWTRSRLMNCAKCYDPRTVPAGRKTGAGHGLPPGHRAGDGGGAGRGGRGRHRGSAPTSKPRAATWKRPWRRRAGASMRTRRTFPGASRFTRSSKPCVRTTRSSTSWWATLGSSNALPRRNTVMRRGMRFWR